MQSLVLATVLTMTTPSASLPDGALIVLEYSNKPVSSYTKSSITHVGMIRLIGGLPWVYEATPAKVRRVPWTEYSRELAELNQDRSQKTRLWVMTPRQPYSQDQIARLDRYLESQVGRRYSIKGYVKKKPGDGVHCAEFVSSALGTTGRFRFDENHTISPASLVRRVVSSHKRPIEVTLHSAPPDTGWCDGAWEGWSAFQHWCSWAVVEAWMMLR